MLHYVHDALGSVVGLLDAGDPEATPDPIPPKLVERYDYDPYGKTYIETWDAEAGGGAGAWESATASAYGNPFAWTAQRYDAALGMYHFPFRSYSPELGRWMQRDPLGYVNGPNSYIYAYSNPAKWIDPMGLKIVYGGSADYNRKVEAHVNELKGKDSRAAAMISDIERSSHTHIIGPREPGETGNSTRYVNTPNSQKPGVGSATNIHYDPDKPGVDEDKKTILPAQVRLMHELGHADAADKGTRHPPNEVNEHGVKRNEEVAVGAEDWVRDDYGLEPRVTYEGKPLQPADPPLSPCIFIDDPLAPNPPDSDSEQMGPPAPPSAGAC